MPEARLLARRQGRVRSRQRLVGSDVGAGASPARGRVAAGAIEAVPSGARVRRCHALARGHFPRGAKGGCSVSLPTSWCMGRRLCDVMARWTSAFEGSRSKWTGLGWTSPSGARRPTASCPGRAADRAGAVCRMLSSASSRALTTRATAFAACRRGGRPALRGCVRRSPASTSRAPRSSRTRSPPMRSHSGRSASRLTTDSTRARRPQISSVPLYPLEFI